jgi:uncharacterized protein YndB with AHSA1/START domain
MLKKILLLLTVALIGLVIVIATRPNDFRYTRSATIAAPPEVLFGKINDLHQFQTWNPWAKVDAAAKITYSGPEQGEGAAYSWAGNNEVGEGTMTITESKPNELVRARMDFKKPFAAINTAEFTFKPVAGGTEVSWAMFGPNNFIGKAIGLCIDCDKMVGTQFEAGLENLRKQTEGAVKP